MAAIVLPPDAPDSTAGFNMTTTITPQNYAGPGPNVHSMAGPSLAQKQPQQQLYSDNTSELILKRQLVLLRVSTTLFSIEVDADWGALAVFMPFPDHALLPRSRRLRRWRLHQYSSRVRVPRG